MRIGIQPKMNADPQPCYRNLFIFFLMRSKIRIRIVVKRWIRILNPGIKYLIRLDPDPRRRPLLFLIPLVCVGARIHGPPGEGGGSVPGAGGYAAASPHPPGRPRLSQFHRQIF
jgi:hypothetical protein